MSAAAMLVDLLGPDRIAIADIGAADGLAKRWRPIAPALRVVAFEPDARADAAADRALGADVQVVNRAAAARDGEASLYLTRKPRCSSLYPPNRAVIERYPDAERYDVVGTSTVSCTTVDHALASLGQSIDFIKIDTQGAELDVLRGAERSLDRCLGIEVEVEFQPLYEGAALFRDVDGHVSARGFELYDLRRTFFARPTAVAAQRRGQLVFGDALYFRPWTALGSRRDAVVLAALLLAYGYADVAIELAGRSPLLSAADRLSLTRIANALVPLAGDVERKDRFVGAGLHLG